MDIAGYICILMKNISFVGIIKNGLDCFFSRGDNSIMHILMNKNIPVLSIELDDTLYTCKKITPINLDAAPLYLTLSEHRLRGAFVEWLADRVPDWCNPSKRKEIVQNYLLNLSDHYWLKPEGSDLDWEDITPFWNLFTEGKYPSPDDATNGMVPKHWDIMNGKRILVKESRDPYYREAKNEAVASRLLDVLKISHVVYVEKENRSYCEDFITVDTELVPAYHIHPACRQQKNESDYAWFMRCCDILQIPVTESEIADMLLFDWVIFNEDRHYNNFGFIRDVNTGKFLGMAPIYDNGNSLWFNKPSSAFHIAYQHCMPFAKNFEKQKKFMQKADLDLSVLSDDVVRQIFYDVWGSKAETAPIQKMMNLVCFHISKLHNHLRVSFKGF